MKNLPQENRRSHSSESTRNSFLWRSDAIVFILIVVVVLTRKGTVSSCRSVRTSVLAIQFMSENEDLARNRQ